MENEIIQQLLEHIAAGGADYFHNIGDDGYIKAPIGEIKTEGSIIAICFTNGMIDLYDTDTIINVKRPENRLNKCEWCYKIKSKEGNLKGYILKDLEVS
ncbi:hypothetical protein LF65_05612 [Clostridium beijerinckii]|uniref:Uncharacterized protein n=1 Tax=Clostridium beijerinckii TaxID=1520 RepID=A0A0B5QIB1_CLOBE|nr:hypothetical protein [Clostridium beijerinckii]AJH02120.1 hypothetical protein LF65_05612 [Clostridium beijerinckii]